MRGDPARDVYSDRRNFSAVGMHARQTINAKRFNAEISQRPNQHLFQVANVAMNVFAVRTEIDDRIADNLSEAVISHLPAAIRFKQRYVSLLQFFFVEENRRAVAAPADGKRVWMFEQKQRVGLGAGFYGLFDLFWSARADS